MSAGAPPSGAGYRIALPEFEGPLDLLLHLCKTHELDIVNIPIAFVTEKYIEYLDVMQALSVDIAADYLLMAATLAYLKSRELVPKPEAVEIDEETGEEVLDPREELIRRLLEYQKYKDAAERLGAQPIEGRNVFPRGSEIEGTAAAQALGEHSMWKLVEALARILEKAGDAEIGHEVIADRMSIRERINQLIDRLEAGSGSFRFDDCFDLALPGPKLRHDVVVTLLAVLELARLKVVRLLQSDDGQTLFIAQVQGAALGEARTATITSANVVEAEVEEPRAPAAEAAPAADARVSDDSENTATTGRQETDEPQAREDEG